MDLSPIGAVPKTKKRTWITYRVEKPASSLSTHESKSSWDDKVYPSLANLKKQYFCILHAFAATCAGPPMHRHPCAS